MWEKLFCAADGYVLIVASTVSSCHRSGGNRLGGVFLSSVVQWGIDVKILVETDCVPSSSHHCLSISVSFHPIQCLLPHLWPVAMKNPSPRLTTGSLQVI